MMRGRPSIAAWPSKKEEKKFFFCRSLIGRLFVLPANQLNSSKSCGVVAAALEQQTKGHRRGTTI